MRTNIEINQGLIQKASELSGLKTKKEIVEKSLQLFIDVHNQKKIHSFKGKIDWQGNLDQRRVDVP
ncbi:type II toxin-antitoxin system VapB family antitoxin [bacterium]|nr:MAG: type II toxin-antitoxin system VapB family antitoxin [bacterium]